MHETGATASCCSCDGVYSRSLPKSLADFKGYSTFNAKAESIAKTNTWREPFTRGRRCLIPIDGFYEWKVLGATGLETGKLPKKPEKQPYVFTVSEASRSL